MYFFPSKFNRVILLFSFNKKVGFSSSITINNLEGKLYCSLADLTQLFFSISFLLCLRLTQNKLSQFLKTIFLIISSFETVLFPKLEYNLIQSLGLVSLFTFSNFKKCSGKI